MALENKKIKDSLRNIFSQMKKDILYRNTNQMEPSEISDEHLKKIFDARKAYMIPRSFNLFNNIRLAFNGLWHSKYLEPISVYLHSTHFKAGNCRELSVYCLISLIQQKNKYPFIKSIEWVALMNYDHCFLIVETQNNGKFVIDPWAEQVYEYSKIESEMTKILDKLKSLPGANSSTTKTFDYSIVSSINNPQKINFSFLLNQEFQFSTLNFSAIIASFSAIASGVLALVYATNLLSQLALYSLSKMTQKTFNLNAKTIFQSGLPYIIAPYALGKIAFGRVDNTLPSQSAEFKLKKELFKARDNNLASLNSRFKPLKHQASSFRRRINSSSGRKPTVT